MKQMGLQDRQAWVVTFDKLLTENDFPQIMRRILAGLEKRYEHPVDVEFTVNLTEDAEVRICLVQCRPMQTVGARHTIEIPNKVGSRQVLFKSSGYTMGGSISQMIDRVIYVRPSLYCRAPLARRYEIARLVGHLNGMLDNQEGTTTMLIGPGRWGTTTPSLGVPVSFAEINNTNVLVEMAYEGGNLMPELSFGTHFFHDLVENSIFYVALFPQKPGVIFNEDFLRALPNLLPEVLPDYAAHADCVGLYDVAEMQLKIVGDVVSQAVLCFARED